MNFDLTKHLVKTIDTNQPKQENFSEESPPKITRKTFEKEFSVKWLEKGFQNTILGLLRSPGNRIYLYIHQDREALINPPSYLLLMTALILFLNKEFSTAEVLAFKELKGAEAFFNNFYYLQLLQAVFLSAIMTYFFYRKSGYNFYENGVLATYVVAQNILIQSVFHVLEYLSNTTWLSNISAFFFLIYSTYAIAQFYRARSCFDYLKAFFSTLLAYIMFLLCMLIFLVLIEVWGQILGSVAKTFSNY